MFGFLLEWQFWRAVVEIIIIAAGIYYLLVFLRGTRGAAVLTGLAVVLVSLTLVTRLLGLDTISWVLSWFFGFFAILLLVIFQPELRRALAELGSRQLFPTQIRRREVIDAISTAAQLLSEKRLGALIAIEGSIGFRGIVERGVEMDCKVTPEAVVTIFFPNTPLHDGGVVIRGDRIAAAACIFPLSEKRGLDWELGTRHRAALGLTEETDAVVVVVSEETGVISVAHRGELHRGLTRPTLVQYLENLLLRPVSRKGRGSLQLRKWLGLPENGWHTSKSAPAAAPSQPNGRTEEARSDEVTRQTQRHGRMKSLLHNWQLKLIAAVLAVMVWFTIQRASSTDVVTIYNVRVEPRLQKGWYVLEVNPAKVAIEIRGERMGVLSVTADHFLVQPDLTTQAKRGRLEVELRSTDVKAPPKISVMNVHPRRATVTLEPVEDAQE